MAVVGLGTEKVSFFVGTGRRSLGAEMKGMKRPQESMYIAIHREK